MPRTLVNFGELRPDDAPRQSQLVVASGVYASANGYRPIGAYTEFADALAGTFNGGAAFIGTAGDSRVIAGDETDLYSLSGSTWTSKLGSLTVNDRWRFTQFGDDVVCVYGGAPVAFDLSANTAAALGGSPPTATFCATVGESGEFVLLGRAGAVQNRVQWSGQGSVTTWTGSQAGSQDLYDGGKIMGLVGGTIAHVIQRFAVTRMSYTGDPAIPFQFDIVTTNYGCAAEGSVIQAGERFFFYGDRGFVMFDGAQFVPIGAERIDRTFRDAYSNLDLVSLYATADPIRNLAIWIMPQKIWLYNWELNRWTTADVDAIAAFPSFSQSTSIDDLDATYGDLDSIPYSLDDPRFTGGEPRLTVVATDGTFGALSGLNVAAQIALPFIEYGQSREARIMRVRPNCDAVDGLTLTADSRKRLGDSESISTFTALNTTGDMPTRIAARHAKLVLDIAAETDWTFLQSLEVEFSFGARR